MRQLAYKVLALSIITIYFSTAFKIQAQQRKCGTDQYHQKLLQSNSQYKSNRVSIEKHAIAYSQNTSALKQNTVVSIPVVVHVIYNTAAQNLSSAQIQSQIDILNEDFRKLNSDTNKVPGAFKNLAADAQIQFCLAKRDPNGNPTNGITYTNTSVTSFSVGDSMKFNSLGGKNAWPRSSYMNIWICNLPGLLGYATFPGGNANVDGVVMDYRSVGRPPHNTVNWPYNLGRTGTHEVGHWLNLYHVWGTGAGGCAQDDLVTDTPLQNLPNYGCPNFPSISCSNGPNGDMFMNYMDYVDDSCMVMFSNGQSTRMNAVLNTGGARNSLLSSLGCVAICTQYPTASVSVTPIQCTGSNNGSLIASGSGTTPPYTFLWSTGQTTSILSALGPGCYTVTVFDALGCTDTATVCLTDPPPLINTAVVNNVSCSGAMDGSIDLTVIGGMPPYMYIWSNGATTQDLYGLDSGCYNVNIFDALGCMTVYNACITQPPPMVINETHFDVTCFGNNDGAINITVSGGVPPYTYSWAKATSISALKDNTIYSENGNWSNALGLNVIAGNTQILNTRRALISFDVAGNIPPGSQIECASLTMNINQIAPFTNGGDSLALHILYEDWGEAGSFNPGPGGAGVQADTGDVTWTNSFYPGTNWGGAGSGGNFNANYSDIEPADNFGPIVWDAQQITNDVQAWYTNPSTNFGWMILGNEGLDSSSAKRLDSRHNPDPNFAPKLDVLYSLGVYTDNIAGIPAGDYTIIVTDAIGCKQLLTITISEPAPIGVTISTNDSTTFCGNIGAQLEGPINPTYFYQWHRFNNPISGANSPFYQAKQSGPHYLMIMDSIGCIDTSNIIVTTRLTNPVAVITTSSPLEMCGAGPGVLSAQTASNYSYEWLRYGNPAPGANSDTLYNATKRGNYKVRVTDTITGCTKVSAKVVVIKHQLPKAELDQLGPISACFGDTIVLRASSSRGTPPFVNYEWYWYSNLLSGQSADSLMVTYTGGFSVRMTDSKGCADKSPRTVVNYSGCPRIGPAQLTSVFKAKIYPNPFNEYFTIDFKSESNQSIIIKIFNSQGKMVLNTEKQYAPLIEINTQEFNSGIYLIELSQTSGIERFKIIKY